MIGVTGFQQLLQDRTVAAHALTLVVRAFVPARPGALSQAGGGRDEDLDAVADDVLHLLGVPVTRIGQDSLWSLGHTRILKLA